MEVVAYLHNADLLLEDEQGVAVIGGSHYVLSLGDRVYLRQQIDAPAKIYQVQISLTSAEHCILHEDEIQLNFEGSREQLQHYLQAITVH